MMTNSSTVKTWRDRLGRPAAFPLHAPTDVERAMEAEIAELRARVTPAGPALSNIAALIADDSYAMTFQTFGQYRSALLKTLAVSPSTVGDATAEMLDMLGRIEPLAMHDKKDRDQWYERLCRARAVQQPLPVPDQAAVVWRSDLVRAVAELIQLRALRDFNRAQEGQALHAEPRVWQQCEGASLIFSIKGLEEVAPGIRAVVTREPTVGKWYAGVNNSQPLPVYGATTRYEGEGRWYLGTGNRIDLYQYDYLQELV